MSVAVDIEALDEQITAYGPRAYVVTVTDEHLPHVVSVEVALQAGLLVTSVGRRTGANLASRPAATFLWPPPDAATDYSLIVDGTAVQPTGEGPLTVRPVAAVLHRVAGAPDGGPTCLPVAST